MRMKVACLAALLLLSVTVRAASKNLQILHITISSVAPSGEIRLRLHNLSDSQPLRIWKESNNWGAFRWRVLVIRNGTVLAAYEDADGVVFTRNIPTFDEIAPGSQIERKLDVNGEYWTRAKSETLQFLSGDRIVVLYDVPPETKAKELRVWYGIASATMTVK